MVNTLNKLEESSNHHMSDKMVTMYIKNTECHIYKVRAYEPETAAAIGDITVTVCY